MDRFYHADLDGGYTDTSINTVRRVAINHLLSHPDTDRIEVYLSPTMNKVYGTVERNGTASFQWRPKKGSLVRLNRDGTHGKHI